MKKNLNHLIDSELNNVNVSLHNLEKNSGCAGNIIYNLAMGQMLLHWEHLNDAGPYIEWMNQIKFHNI